MALLWCCDGAGRVLVLRAGAILPTGSQARDCPAHGLASGATLSKFASLPSPELKFQRPQRQVDVADEGHERAAQGQHAGNEQQADEQSHLQLP
jgi:hypothetical protein